MPKDFSQMGDSNRSSNPSIHEVSDPSRRTLLRGAAAAARVVFAVAPREGFPVLSTARTRRTHRGLRWRA